MTATRGHRAPHCVVHTRSPLHLVTQNGIIIVTRVLPRKESVAVHVTLFWRGSGSTTLLRRVEHGSYSISLETLPNSIDEQSRNLLNRIYIIGDRLSEIARMQRTYIPIAPFCQTTDIRE